MRITARKHPTKRSLPSLRQWQKVPANKKGLVWQKLVDLNRAEVERFMLAMQRAVQRQITVVRVLPLHGCPLEFDSIVKAVEFVDSYEYSAGSAAPFVKYEMGVTRTSRICSLPIFTRCSSWLFSRFVFSQWGVAVIPWVNRDGFKAVSHRELRVQLHTGPSRCGKSRDAKLAPCIKS